jgi:hypothetical protein
MSVSVFSIFVYRNTIQDACALSNGRWPSFRHVIINGVFNRYQFLRLDHDIRHFVFTITNATYDINSVHCYHSLEFPPTISATRQPPDIVRTRDS